MLRILPAASTTCAVAAVALSLVGSPRAATMQPAATAAPEPVRISNPSHTAATARTVPPPTARSPLGPTPVKGLTIGPIESALHRGRGYGTEAFESTLDNSRALGANWIALTVFGRIASLSSTDISLSFEQPFEANRKAVVKAIHLAHERGLRVMLVPHLWVESGGWRGELAPRNGAWDEWARAYERFVLAWARVAAETDVDMFSVGVELRSWVTSAQAGSFVNVIERVKSVYRGILTYAANWDDVEETAILGHLDVIGINAFFPLAEQEGTRLPALRERGAEVTRRVGDLHRRFGKAILFTEVGYTNREDPALRPWEWPDGMNDVKTSPVAQAEAFMGLLAPIIDEPWFAGFFIWRVYSDPFDSSQESEWGFSPLYRDAELVLRDAFATRWRGDAADLAADPPRLVPTPFLNSRAVGVAKF